MVLINKFTNHETFWEDKPQPNSNTFLYLVNSYLCLLDVLTRIGRKDKQKFICESKSYYFFAYFFRRHVFRRKNGRIPLGHSRLIATYKLNIYFQ